jgi:predicted CoA-substrate-specific enzyme activase
LKADKETTGALYRDMPGEGVTIGIDVGSLSAKAALLTGEELYLAKTATAVGMQQTADYLLKKLLKEAGAGWQDVSAVIGTGYGRIALEFGKVPARIVTEISCHGLGAHYLNPETETIVDIGGQDSKAIRIDPKTGKVEDFIMNERCAAGTGRFLEKVSILLEVPLDEAGGLSLGYENAIEISSQCVVFAESEIISLKARGVSKPDILRAVNLASARRVRNLVNRIGLREQLVFAGGVSNNSGMRKALEEVIGANFAETRVDMIYNGAIGAAIFARRPQ